MKKLLISIFTVVSLTAGFSFAEDDDQEEVYGSQLMTKEECREHHSQMRAAKTPDERDQIRKEHHARMKERAAAQGVTIPDEPPERGSGGGMGKGCR